MRQVIINTICGGILGVCLAPNGIDSWRFWLGIIAMIVIIINSMTGE